MMNENEVNSQLRAVKSEFNALNEEISRLNSLPWLDDATFERRIQLRMKRAEVFREMSDLHARFEDPNYVPGGRR